MRFVGHLALATYGVVILSFLFGLVSSILIRPPNERFVDYVIIGPTFALPILLGLLIGYKLGRRMPPWASRLLWVPSFLLLAVGLYGDYKDGYPNFGVQVWDNYFGAGCSASDCAGEVLETAPLLSAIAYAVGAELGRLTRRTTEMSDGLR
jgi:hypothetical protein